MTYAVRGAICVSINTKEAICQAANALFSEVISKNALTEQNIVSVIFSCTADIYAYSPAAAVRESGGFSRTAFFCVREMAVRGMLKKCLRVLIHFTKEESAFLPIPCYIGEARILRSDIE